MHTNIHGSQGLLPHLDELRITVANPEPCWYHCPDGNLAGSYWGWRRGENWRLSWLSHGGGVAIYTRDCLLAKPKHFATTGTTCVESVWVQVSHLSCTSPVLIGCCYRPTGSSWNATEQLLSEIEVALSCHSSVSVCGDINIDLINENHPLKEAFLEFHLLTHPNHQKYQITYWHIPCIRPECCFQCWCSWHCHFGSSDDLYLIPDMEICEIQSHLHL